MIESWGCNSNHLSLSGPHLIYTKMCGRYAMKMNYMDLLQYLKDHKQPVESQETKAKPSPSLNLAPNTLASICRKDKDSNGFVLDVMKWALQPHWAKEPVKFSTFNVRAESLKPLKPVWSSAKYRRCIVFMNGYYEWKHGIKERLPYYIKRKDNDLMCVLAVWDTNEHFGDVPTFAMVTTDASPRLKEIHPRMPVVVHNLEHAIKWVSGEWPDVLKEIISDNDDLEFYRVDTAVNKVGAQGDNLNKPLKQTKASSFFQPIPKKVKDGHVGAKVETDIGHEPPVKNESPVKKHESPIKKNESPTKQQEFFKPVKSPHGIKREASDEKLHPKREKKH